jgi:hypothetical protein
VSSSATDLFSSLQNIDVAATKGNYQVAVQNYQAAMKDFDDILQLLPKQKGSAVSR